MPRPIPFRVLKAKYLASMDSKMVSEGTLKTYDEALRIPEKWVKEGKAPVHPRDWSVSDVRAFYEFQRTTVRLTTTRLRMTILIMFLKWCGNKNVSEVRLRIRAVRSKVRWLTKEQVGMLLAGAKNPAELAAIACLVYTGMRASELCDLRWQYVQQTHITFTGKGRKERSVPLSPLFWDTVQPYLKWLKKRGDLFIQTFKGLKMTPKYLGKIINRLGKRVGILVSPHDLRRTFGQQLYLAKYPIPKIQVLYGHDSIEQTIRYLGIDRFDLSDMADFQIDYRDMYRRGSSQ